MKTFELGTPHEERAMQMWQILVGKVKNRQTITYEGLTKLMYENKEASGGIHKGPLDHIAAFCIENKLPHLTILVVGKNSGIPGSGIKIDFSTARS